MNPLTWFHKPKPDEPDKPDESDTTEATKQLELERRKLKDRTQRADEVVSALAWLRQRNEFREQILLTVEEAARHGR